MNNGDKQARLRAVLVQAQGRLKGTGWTQLCAARAEDGRRVNTNSPEAVRFCTTGAIRASVETEEEFAAATQTVRAVLELFSSACIADWNDATERTQNQVLAAFDKAIEACI